MSVKQRVQALEKTKLDQNFDVWVVYSKGEKHYTDWKRNEQIPAEQIEEFEKTDGLLVSLVYASDEMSS